MYQEVKGGFSSFLEEMGYLDSDYQSEYATPNRKARLQASRPKRWLYSFAMSMLFVVYVSIQSYISTEEPFRSKLCLSMGHLLICGMLYLYKLAKRYFRKGSCFDLQRSFFFDRYMRQWDLPVIIVAHISIVGHAIGTLLLGYAYFFANKSMMNQGVTTSQMVVYLFFLVVLSKVMFKDVIFNVQKLALLFLIVGPMVVWIQPVYLQEDFLNPIYSYSFVLAGTLSLVVRSISVKYLVNRGKSRYDVVLYVLFVDSAFWTIIALTYMVSNKHIING